MASILSVEFSLHSLKPRQQPSCCFKRLSAALLHETSGNRTCFSGVVTSFLVDLVRFNCARNSRVDYFSCPEGCEMNAEGTGALSRILHALWMHHFISTRSPLVPYLMRALRAKVLALALYVVSGASVRPPLLWLVFGPSSVRAFFPLALSGFARFGLGVLVLVFSLSLFLFAFPLLCSG